MTATIDIPSPTTEPASHHWEESHDPRSVQRHGKGYRYNQAGWIVLHVEGDPYERGVQHGRLLAPEIAAHVRCFAATLGHKSPADAWKPETITFASPSSMMPRGSWFCVPSEK